MIKSTKPFFTWPLERLVEVIGPMADGIRTLPDHQLADERAKLVFDCATGGSIPERTMLAIYDAETARRADPELQFDDALDLALARLERQTNDDDRAFAHDVGRKLFAIGGRAALDRAFNRMLAKTSQKRRGSREKVLSKRWQMAMGSLSTLPATPGRRQVTIGEIEAQRTPAGGFTRATLSQWGVPWPPPNGWIKQLTEHGAPYRHDETKRTAA